MTSAHPHKAAPALAWPAALAFATVAGTLLISCMMPFVALAAMVARSMPPGRAVATLVAIWSANQLIGFALLGYPATAYTFAWGVALLAAALAAMAAARAVDGGTTETTVTRLFAGFALAFAVSETALFAFASVVGGVETFAPAIVAQLALNETLWFAGLVALHIVLTRSAPRWFGPSAALRLAP